MLKAGTSFPFALYVAATVLGGLLLVWAGYSLGRSC